MKRPDLIRKHTRILEEKGWEDGWDAAKEEVAKLLPTAQRAVN